MNKILLLFIISLLFFQVSAQSISVSSPGFSPNTLVQQYLAGDGVVISNVTLNGRTTVSPNGNPTSINQVRLGVFGASGSFFPLDSGLIMTTNSLNMVEGPNSSDGLTGADIEDGPPTDDDLALLTTDTLYNICMLEFDFVAESATLQFEYVFASEEYPEYACSESNDVFAFFITGTNPVTDEIETWNVAIIPDDTDADNDGEPDNQYPVNINNINLGPGIAGTQDNCCPISYAAFYYENDGNGTEFDAWTVTREGHDIDGDVVGGLIAESCLVPCETYHMKLAIANVHDNRYDSGVFLKKGSFSSPQLEVIERNDEGRSNILVPGCNYTDVYYALSVSAPCTQSYTVEYNVHGTSPNLVLNEHYTITPYVLNTVTGEMELSTPILNSAEELVVNLHEVYDPDNENIEFPLFRIEMIPTVELDNTFEEEIVVRLTTDICDHVPPFNKDVDIPVKGNPAPEITMPENITFCEKPHVKIIEIELNIDDILPGYSTIWECDSSLVEVNEQSPDRLSRKLLTTAPVDVNVIVVDAMNCHSDTLLIPVDVTPFPVVEHSIVPESTIACSPMEVILTAEVEPVSASVEWVIESLGMESPHNPYHFISMKEGHHPYWLVVETAPGCSATIKSAFTTIDFPVADFTWSPEVAQRGQPVQFFSQATGNSPIMRWLWQFGNGGTSDNENPFHTYRIPQDQTFPVTLTVTNDACSHDTTKYISVTDKFFLFVPNAFNPASQNMANRTFKPIIGDVLKYHLLIYNRQGECIFQSINAEEGWDGTFNGEPCNVGTYIYKIIYVKYSAVDTENVKKGTVTLIH